MRLFVAIELPPAVVSAAEAVAQSLRERVARIAPHARLTWVAPDRLHVTVRFIGEVDDERAAAIGRVLGPPLQTPSFTIAAGAAGAFPARGAPRALWLALTSAPGVLADLEREVSARLDRAGVAWDARPFRPHVTLARVREPAGLRASALLAGVEAPPHGSGCVDAITLFVSRLSPRGPTYGVLQRTSLGG